MVHLGTQWPFASSAKVIWLLLLLAGAQLAKATARSCWIPIAHALWHFGTALSERVRDWPGGWLRHCRVGRGQAGLRPLRARLRGTASTIVLLFIIVLEPVGLKRLFAQNRQCAFIGIVDVMKQHPDGTAKRGNFCLKVDETVGGFCVHGAIIRAKLKSASARLQLGSGSSLSCRSPIRRDACVASSAYCSPRESCCSASWSNFSASSR